MFLQDTRLSAQEKNKMFYNCLQSAKENNLDMLVFPEHMYCPDDGILDELAFLSYEDECDYNEIAESYKKYAIMANCPIVVSRIDKYNYIYGLFVSPHNYEVKWYGKHIATMNSSFELENYPQVMEDIFKPIEYNGYRIGITICYDSTKSIFSKAYGNIDLLLNLTGGHVDYKKWSIYQKARALENKCNCLCTMAYFSDNSRNKSYVFGFDGFGKKLPYYIINNKNYHGNDLENGIYVFEVDKKHSDFITYDTSKGEIDEFMNVNPSVSKNITINLSIEEILKLLIVENRIDEGLYSAKIGNDNLIIVDVPEHKIENPVIVEKLLYHSKLKEYKNKKYLILNRWDNLDYEYYQKFLSTILKVRAAENFCITLLVSPIVSECIQVGLNKNIQIVRNQNGKYGLDFKRATGPESFWKNNSNIGIRADWREKYEMLIDMVNLRS